MRLLRGRARCSSPAACARVAGILFLMLAVAVTLLSACAPSVKPAASQNRARLDGEIHNAQLTVGIPAILLSSIQQQEVVFAANLDDGTDASGAAAAEGYANLYDQVVALEKLTPTQIRQRATLDLQSLTLALAQVQAQGFSEASTFQGYLTQAQQQLEAASTATDLFAADGAILDQAGAVSQVIPVYHQMQALNALIEAQSKALGATTAAPLQCAIGDFESFYTSNAQVLANVGLNPKNAIMIGGTTTFTFSGWPSQNLKAFQAAKTSADFADLSATVLAEMSQLTADSQALLPQQTAAAVAAFQADVQSYTTDGGKDTSFQQQASQDAQALASTKTLADLTALAKAVAKHRQAFALPLAQVVTTHDLDTLTNLVLTANATTNYDPYNGISYPVAYPYIGFHYATGRDWAGDPLDEHDTRYGLGGTGIGDARVRLAGAHTLDDYKVIEDEIQMFITNVTALISNLAQMPKTDSARQAWSMTAHRTDLDLINHYGLGNTKVVVVSLVEQKARLYQNGKLVRGSDGKPYAFDVTTGNPDLPSVPGIHCVTERMANYDDISPFPKGSPYYYNPTHINFGMVYSDYGFLVHDAWWRDTPGGMGYLTNLPHYDPIAFNSGSHGCINFHYANGDMAKVWNFTTIGTPILVY